MAPSLEDILTVNRSSISLTVGPTEEEIQANSGNQRNYNALWNFYYCLAALEEYKKKHGNCKK